MISAQRLQELQELEKRKMNFDISRATSQFKTFSTNMAHFTYTLSTTTATTLNFMKGIKP